MVIFIDESGTNKQTGHSTTAVVFVEVTKLEEFDKRIKEIELNLKINSFHWSEERWEVRNKFLEKIIELNFTVKVAIFKNPANPEKMLETVFEYLIPKENIKYLYIDGKKSKRYEHILKKQLRSKNVSVTKLKTVNDKSYPGIQVADCLAGLVRRSYDSPDEVVAKKWLEKLLSTKKIEIQLLFGI